MKEIKTRLRNITAAAALVSTAVMLAACGTVADGEAASAEIEAAQEKAVPEETELQPAETEALPETPEASVEETEGTAAGDYSLAELAALLGMKDAESAECLGGGEENWTEDGGFYIGRIYQVPLFGEVFPVFTSCDEEKTVNAVSVWLADEADAATQEEADKWVERITTFTGVEPAYHDAAESEGGSRSWKWIYDDIGVSLYWMGDLLSINMNPMVGELK